MPLTSEIVKDTGAARRFRLLAPLAALLLVLVPLMLVPAMIWQLSFIWRSTSDLSPAPAARRRPMPDDSRAQHRAPGGRYPALCGRDQLRCLATVSYRYLAGRWCPRASLKSSGSPGSWLVTPGGAAQSCPQERRKPTANLRPEQALEMPARCSRSGSGSYLELSGFEIEPRTRALRPLRRVHFEVDRARSLASRTEGAAPVPPHSGRCTPPLPRRTRRTARAAASQPDLQRARPVKALAHEARLAACGRP